MFADFENSFTFKFGSKFAIKYYVFHHYTVLWNLKDDFYHFTTTAAAKTYIEIHSVFFYLMQFILSDTYYHYILLTQHVPVMCEICCKFFIFQRNNVSAHECAQPPWQCLQLQTSEMRDAHVYFIRHVPPTPIYDPLNYKNCIKIQKRVLLRRIRYLNWRTLWYGWHGFEQRIIDKRCRRVV